MIIRFILIILFNKITRILSKFHIICITYNNVQISIIQEVDSAYLHKIGIINPPEKAYLIQNSQNKEVSKSLIEHTTDTILKVDSVSRIIIKEKELSKWQHLKMDAGVAAMCIATALLLLFLLKLLIRK